MFQVQKKVVLVFNNEKPKNETVPEVENILPNDERILLASQKDVELNKEKIDTVNDLFS